MLLVDFDDWKPSFECKVDKDKPGKTIKTIWDRLRVLDLGLPNRPAHPDYVSWRDLLKACLVIHQEQNRMKVSQRPIFDVDHTTAESLSCLVLELWGSEIFQIGEPDNYVFRARRDWQLHGDPEENRNKTLNNGLLQLMSTSKEHKYRKALYRSWLLLNAVMSPSQFKRDRFRLSPSIESPDGIASRHWYLTASPLSLSRSKNKYMPTRLPGNFCTRGDWFMAVAKGSRSGRLGERAIDLLSSRRAQISRLQNGIGLPVRGFPEEERQGSGWTDPEFRSTLTTYDEEGKPTLLRLNRLWWLGAQPSVGSTFKNENEFNFFWLFRSRIADYDRHSRIWSKWLLYTFDEFENITAKVVTSPEDRYKRAEDLFAEYDRLEEWVKLAPAEENPTKEKPKYYEQFSRFCDELEETLKRATLKPQ
jgi:hypothetical protein